MELHKRIKNNEYKRLPQQTKNKLTDDKEDSKIQDFIKNPILIKNSYNNTDISEKMRKQLTKNIQSVLLSARKIILLL